MKFKVVIYSPWTRPEGAKKKSKYINGTYSSIEIHFRIYHLQKKKCRIICPSIKRSKNTITFEVQTYITDLSIRRRLSLKTFIRLKLGLGASTRT